MPNNIKIFTKTKQIIDFVESLSIFVEHVHITEVHDGGFSFRVKVPFWYKKLFGWWIKMRIKNKLGPKIPHPIKFEFEIHT